MLKPRESGTVLIDVNIYHYDNNDLAWTLGLYLRTLINEFERGHLQRIETSVKVEELERLKELPGNTPTLERNQ